MSKLKDARKEIEAMLGRELDILEIAIFDNGYLRGEQNEIKRQIEKLERGADKLIGELDVIQEHRHAKGE